MARKKPTAKPSKATIEALDGPSSEAAPDTTPERIQAQTRLAQKLAAPAPVRPGEGRS